ncbi:MAG: peptidyl-prolyl cis-trans isomerase [Chlamydiales bacterium]|nr:peptidyl-prolyl cis-trans isomerase [Chlamydiia bacterium]MCP5506918.1 peptidyl-prolyl cis-trans isomerase [Chlamydiales bacterium]
MKKIVLSFSLLSVLTLSPLDAVKNDMFLMQNVPTHIEVNNRILAVVNGKPISVYDLMKKMDIIFYKQFPQYTSNAEARFQFYQMGWRQVLNEMIDKELILADAEENKVEVSHGDVRQEMEKMFGPDILTNLDSIGMTYEEAIKILEGDIIIRRVVLGRVNSKAFRQVTPQMIRKAYDEYAKENARPPKWSYYVVSIRDEKPKDGAMTASIVHRLLAEENVDIEQLKEKVPQTTSRVNVSEPFTHNEKEVSESYLEVLKQLKPNTFSMPIAQKSRASNGTVYRIFYLKESIPGGVPPLQEVENMLKGKLLDNAVAKESDAYLKHLREHFDVSDEQISIPDDFQPFILR